MPLTYLATPAPTLQALGWIWLDRLGTAADFGVLPGDRGADEAATAAVSGELEGGRGWPSQS